MLISVLLLCTRGYLSRRRLTALVQHVLLTPGLKSIVLAALASSAVHAQGVDYHLGIGHTAGESVGLDDGVTQFDAFVPLGQPTSDSLIYTDLELLLFNERARADGASLGIGGRIYNSQANRIRGSYLHYDYRDTGFSQYGQISAGVESLGATWDWRINAHVPVGARVRQVPWGSEVALTGVHAEMARLLASRGPLQLRGAAGVYGFWNDDADIEAVGPRLRLEARLDDQLWVSAFVHHDDEFATTGGVAVSWRYGLTKHFQPRSSSDNLANRLGDPIERLNYVALARRRAGITTTTLALDQEIPLDVEIPYDGVIDEFLLADETDLVGDYVGVSD